MVDTPVGKKCRDCSQNKTHLQESSPRQVLFAFTAALVTAFAGGVLLHNGLSYILILAFPYGALIGEAGLRAGQRRRSLAMQVAVGAAAVAGSMLGSMVQLTRAVPGAEGGLGFNVMAALEPMSLVITGVAVAVAVSRVRFL